MASIERRTGDNGKPQYRARWRDAEGRSRRSRWFDRKLDADRHRATVEADLHRDTYVDMNNPVTVTEAIRQHVAARTYRPTSLRAWEQLVRLYVEPAPLGRRPLVKVRPSEIQVWATGLAKRISAHSLRIQLGRLRMVFGTAVQDGVIARNPVLPVNRLSLPKSQRRPIVPLTVEQVRALADAMPARYRAMVITQAGLGLRIGELLALRVEDVNFLRRTVHVEHQIENRTRRRVEPKTPKSRRDIPLPAVVAEALARHIEAYPPLADGTIFTPGPGWGATHRGYVPTTSISHSMYGDRVSDTAKRAGLPPTKSHDLRHHYASVLLHAGESVHAVAERLGHTDARLVLTTYGHLMPDTEDRTRQAVDAAWSAGTDRTAEALGE